MARQSGLFLVFCLPAEESDLFLFKLNFFQNFGVDDFSLRAFVEVILQRKRQRKSWRTRGVRDPEKGESNQGRERNEVEGRRNPIMNRKWVLAQISPVW